MGDLIPFGKAQATSDTKVRVKKDATVKSSRPAPDPSGPPMELEENTDSYWSRYRSGKDAELTFTRYKGGGAAVVEHSDHPGEAFVMNDGDNGRGQVTFAPELDELFWLSICWKASAYLMES